MLSAYDSHNRFVCYGTYVRWASNGETYGVFPDDPEAVFDDQGHELVAAKRSALYGFKMCPLKRENETPYALRRVTTPFVCVCAEDWVMGFSCWYAYKSGAVTLRFAQYGDPRLNGAPVVDRKNRGELIGMYLVKSWLDETKAECVPCDLFFDRVPTEHEGDARRESTVKHEIESGWAERTQNNWSRVSRAMEINDWVFAETYDRKARWVTHVFPDREYVCEDECKYLQDSFQEAVNKIERGVRSLKWSNGTTIEIQREPRGVGFFLEFRIPELAPTPPLPTCGQEAKGEDDVPCVDWY